MSSRLTTSDFYSDTDPRAFEAFIEAQRRLGPAGRARQVFELTEMAAKASEAGVRMLYPDADEREVFLRVAARRLGDDVVRRVYGWDPQSHA